MDTNDGKTTETEAVDGSVTTPVAEAQAPSRRRRWLFIGGGILAVLVLLNIGMAIGHHKGGDDHDGPPWAERGDRDGGPPWADHGDRDGGPFGRGGDDGPGFRGGHDGDGHGGPFGRGDGPGGMRGHGGGGPAVVEAVAGGRLTVEPLMGPHDSVTVLVEKDTDVSARGDDGPMDVEDAAIGDIRKGAIVLVRPDRDGDEDKDDDDDETKTVTASEILILRAAGE